MRAKTTVRVRGRSSKQPQSGSTRGLGSIRLSLHSVSARIQNSSRASGRCDFPTPSDNAGTCKHGPTPCVREPFGHWHHGEGHAPPRSIRVEHSASDLLWTPKRDLERVFIRQSHFSFVLHRSFGSRTSSGPLDSLKWR